MMLDVVSGAISGIISGAIGGAAGSDSRHPAIKGALWAGGIGALIGLIFDAGLASKPPASTGVNGVLGETVSFGTRRAPVRFL